MLDWNKKEAPVLGLQGSGGGLGYLTGASGIDINDFFSTTLYTGNSGSNRSIQTGIDNTTGTFMAWFKCRSDNRSNHLVANVYPQYGGNLGWKCLNSDSFYKLGGQNDFSPEVTSATSTGFTLSNTGGEVNLNNETYVGWNFKAAPKFFNVIKYTGNGQQGQTINHGLASVPGFIILKNLTTNASWFVWHKELGAGKHLVLNSGNAETNDGGNWYSSLTDTSFTFDRTYVSNINTNNQDYVAMMWADEDVVKCGYYQGVSGTANHTITGVGFKPQWLMVKSATGSGTWSIFDNTRSSATNINKYIRANINNEEASRSSPAYVTFNDDGWSFPSSAGDGDFNNATVFIYVAIAAP